MRLLSPSLSKSASMCAVYGCLLQPPCQHCLARNLQTGPWTVAAAEVHPMLLMVASSLMYCCCLRRSKKGGKGGGGGDDEEEEGDDDEE